MIPIVDDFKQRFGVDDFIVVGDSGFMISRNIRLPKSGGYKFIVGGRIKKYGKDVTEWIDTLKREDGLYHERVLDNGDRLVVTYSSKRAAKDAYNRKGSGTTEARICIGKSKKRQYQ